MHLHDDLIQFFTTNYYMPTGLELGEVKSFLAHGILDSTGVLELVTFLETRFGISVSDEELVPQNLDSLAALVAFIERKGGGA